MTRPSTSGGSGAYRFDTDCPDCIAARLHSKAQGFRDWRTAYACYEHAAVNWDEWVAANPQAPDDAGDEQPDLFGAPA